MRAGFSRTPDILGQISGLFGGGKIDEALYEELETILLDFGCRRECYQLAARGTAAEKSNAMILPMPHSSKPHCSKRLSTCSSPWLSLSIPATHKPFIIMLTGVNGAGKTTTIGKLARYFQAARKTVLLAAGDTFRAAAREQLIAWGERNQYRRHCSGEQRPQKADPAAVIFDAINAAKARGTDIVLADTAGRLATQLHLMEEIKKVKRVIGKAEPGAPHETLLVLDANTGQNAINQVQAFDDALDLTGLVVTKLDGTAKGGVIAAIARQRERKSALADPLHRRGRGHR